MNKFVETILGVFIFLAFFVIFEIGFFSVVQQADNFSHATTELNQLIREEGGVTGRAADYYDYVKGTKHNYKIQDYQIKEPEASGYSSAAINTPLKAGTQVKFVISTPVRPILGFAGKYINDDGKGAWKRFSKKVQFATYSRKNSSASVGG